MNTGLLERHIKLFTLSMTNMLKKMILVMLFANDIAQVDVKLRGHIKRLELLRVTLGVNGILICNIKIKRLKFKMSGQKSETIKYRLQKQIQIPWADHAR